MGKRLPGSEVGRQRRFGRETVYVRKGWVAPQTDQIRLLWGGGNHGSRLMCSRFDTLTTSGLSLISY